MLNILKNAAMSVTFFALAQELARDHMTYGGGNMFIIVGAFIIGMLLTPPDVISQVLLALPMWVLFEAGLIASKIIFRDRLLEDEQYDDDYDDEPMAETAAAGAADNQTLSDEEMNAEAEPSGTASDSDKSDK